MIFRLNDIFLTCHVQGDNTVCKLLLADEEDAFLMEDDQVVGVSGQIFNEYFGYGCYGVNIQDVVMNYTQYLEQHAAAGRIQRTWKRYRASRVIKNAWKHWQMKRNELWNPRCFVGVAFLALEAVKAVREVC
jgi:hypothetical protein